MAELKVVLVDDEPKAIKNMTAMLSYFPFVEVIGTASNATDARLLLSQITPDVLFLDIQMPTETGFELLASLEHRPFEVVFVTAYQEHALKAFKANALDYLTKPVDIDDLEAVINKSINRKKEKTEAYKNEQYTGAVDKALHSVATQGKMDKLMLPHLNGFRLVELDHIVYIEADGNYSVIHLIDFQKIVVSKQLGHLEPLLPESTFFRIHKSTIINLHHIEGFSSPTQEVSMKDGAELAVSRRRLEEFQEKITGLVR